MEEYQAPIKAKTLSIDLSRFKTGQDLNRRQAELKQYCDRMPQLSPSLIATKMAHLSEDELAQNFDYITKHARNFTAYWKWCFMKKRD